MDYHEVREIVDKYWLGESTLEEEKQLKNFFANAPDPLPDDLKEIADLFCFYKEEALQSTGEIPLPWVNREMRKRRAGSIGLLQRYWEYAAIFLLVLGSIWILKPGTRAALWRTTADDTFQDPEKALDATQKALQILATNLNKSKEQMQKLALFHEAEQKVKEGR